MGPTTRPHPAGVLLLAGLILPPLAVSPHSLPPRQEATASPGPSATSSPTPPPSSEPSSSPSSPPQTSPTPPAPTAIDSTATTPVTATPAASVSPSVSPTSADLSPTPSVTASQLPTATPSRVAAAVLRINEVAWAGTLASANDEWIELHNPGGQPVSLDGWRLTDGDDIDILLSGTIQPHAFYLLERTDDSTVSSVAADSIYTGPLRNGGETLHLLDPAGQLVDSANLDGGPWPAGNAAERRSMERVPGPDTDSAWLSFSGTPFATDAQGSPIRGSPRGANLLQLPSSPTATLPAAATPTPIPSGRVLINEIAWSGSHASAADEWIELHNPASLSIDIGGWRLTDGNDIDIALDGVLPPAGYYLLERTDDSTVFDVEADFLYTGALRDGGETLQIFDPSGQRIDAANLAGGEWPAGEAETRRSMERAGTGDLPNSWQTFGGNPRAHDADGEDILGSPRAANSVPLPSATPSPAPSALPPSAILINEVAWAGTNVSASDEWIELHNRGAEPIELDGWSLTDDDDIRITLAGAVAPGGFFLLERTDDETIWNIAADQLYSGGLRNSGEHLRLIDPGGRLVDSANLDGGSWPGGRAINHRSMERYSHQGAGGGWGTFTGYRGVGKTKRGGDIAGTPKSANSVLYPTPTPTWIPGQLIINEALIRPHYDWDGTGKVSTGDEFVELYNRGPGSVRLQGFSLDDIAEGGSRPFILPGIRLEAGHHVAFFRSETHIALNDSGDRVRLLDPSGGLIDQIEYQPVRAYNLSFGRLPDASNRMAYGLWPTPGEPNLLYVEEQPPEPHRGHACRRGEVLYPRLPRVARSPAQRRWFESLGLALCLDAAAGNGLH